MEKRRMGLFLGTAAGIAALFLWGTFRFGTASELFPETPAPSVPTAAMPKVSAALEEETEECAVLRYASVRQPRDTPLRDPFRLPSADIGGNLSEKSAAVAPAENQNTGGAAISLEPMLRGILGAEGSRRALFEVGGQTVTAREGEEVCGWTVQEVGRKQVRLSGASGERRLSL